MFDEDALMQILINEMALELQCQAQECTHGVGGARWKTPALEAQLAMQMFNIDRADAHDQQAGGAAQHGGGGKVLLAKIPHPVVCAGAAKRTSSILKDWEPVNQIVK